MNETDDPSADNRAADTTTKVKDSLTNDGAEAAAAVMMHEVNESWKSMHASGSPPTPEQSQQFLNYLDDTATMMFQEGMLEEVSTGFGLQSLEALSNGDGYVSSDDLARANFAYSAEGPVPNPLAKAMVAQLTARYNELANDEDLAILEYLFPDGKDVLPLGISARDLNFRMQEHELMKKGDLPISNAERSFVGNYLADNPVMLERVLGGTVFDRAAIERARQGLFEFVPPPDQYEYWANSMRALDALYGSFNLLSKDGQTIDARNLIADAEALTQPEVPPRPQPEMSPDLTPEAAPAPDVVQPQQESHPEPDYPSENAPSNGADSSQAQPSDSNNAPLYWDPELGAVNAHLEHPEGLQPGQKYWKLVSAEFLPEGNAENQSQGRHHVYYRVLDSNGSPITGAGIAQGWPTGQDQAVTKPDDGGLGNIPMYGGGKFWPENGESGPYSAWVTHNGLASDKVTGLGLVNGAHTSYLLTFQLATWGGEQSSANAAQPETSFSPPSGGGQESAPSAMAAQTSGNHGMTADGYYADQHPDLNLDLRGYFPVSAATWTDDGGPNDPGAPQLASMFNSSHPRDGNGLPIVTGLFKVNDWNWDDSNPSNGTGSRGGPIDYAEVNMMGFQTTPGEPVYLPESGYTIGGGFEGQVLYVDHAKGEIAIAYNRSGTVSGGYTIHIRGLNIDPAIQQGSEITTSNALGTAAGGSILVAMRDRGKFMDIRFQHHWWADITPHPN